MLAGVAPFAIENGLVPITGDRTRVRIHMVNTQSIAVAEIQTPNGRVQYSGDASIDGVPGTAAPILLDFLDIAGSSCGALLPTGNAVDVIEGVEATLIDNGMPVVVMRAADLGKTGAESPAELEADKALKARVEAIRLEAGRRMNLGDVTRKTVPKMCLVSAPKNGGAIATRNFIPHTVHKAIGVFGAVSVATACVVPGSVTTKIAPRHRHRQLAAAWTSSTPPASSPSKWTSNPTAQASRSNAPPCSAPPARSCPAKRSSTTPSGTATKSRARSTSERPQPRWRHRSAARSARTTLSVIGLRRADGRSAALRRGKYAAGVAFE